MPILNYTTKISVDRTINEIHKMLRRCGANAVMTEYGPKAEVAAVSFRLEVATGTVQFKLPARAERVQKVLERTAPPRYRTREQADRVAWRIVKDWLEAQLAIIETEQVDALEAFLPYAKAPDGRTLYEIVHQEGLPQLLEHHPS